MVPQQGSTLKPQLVRFDSTLLLSLSLLLSGSSWTTLLLLRKTREHSGNSPRSANKDSSSSPIVNTIATSASVHMLPALTGLSNILVVPTSEYHSKWSSSSGGEDDEGSSLKGTLVVVVVFDEAAAAAAALVEEEEEEWFLEVGKGWLWSEA